jgi:NADH:ubiquinone oxidoreductase subunit H
MTGKRVVVAVTVVAVTVVTVKNGERKVMAAMKSRATKAMKRQV